VIVFFVLTIVFFTLSGEAIADSVETDDSSYNIYFRPAIRWGTNDRVLYIVDFLIPLYQGDRSILFANPKFTPNDRDGWEFNVGLGYRHLLWDDNLLLGLNAFYDKRRSDWGNYHEQWGIGAEIMADIPLEKMDIGLTGRFNFYYPTSHTKMEYGEGGAGGGYILQDLGIYSVLGGELLVEEPMRGFDYEVGLRIPCLSDYVETWAYAGGYNFFGKYTEHVDGFMTRLEVIPTDFLRLNFEYKYDNVNQDEFYGEVAVEVPFSIGNLVTGKNPFEGIGRRLSGSRELSARMVEPVRRDVDIVVVEKSIETGGGGGGGTGGLIEEVVFVSETGSDTTGDGSFGNPYNSINRAMTDGRILAGTCTTIHVMNDDPGAGTAGGGHVNIPNLLIWGSGVDHPNYPSISNLMSGYPTVLRLLGQPRVIDISVPNTTVMGLDIRNTDHPAIMLSNGTGTVIRDNKIDLINSGFGIDFSVAGTIGTALNPALITNNEINMNGNSNSYGIDLTASGDIFATIADNKIDINNSNGWICGISVDSSAGNINSTISGNEITVVTWSGISAYGIYLNSAGSILNTTISGNDMSGGIAAVPVAGSSCGFYLRSGTGLIGTSGNPVRINNNIGGSIYGLMARWMIILDSGSPGGGNAVDWSGNTGFVPVGGPWNGNHGPLGELRHNFVIPPDYVNP